MIIELSNYHVGSESCSRGTSVCPIHTPWLLSVGSTNAEPNPPRPWRPVDDYQDEVVARQWLTRSEVEGR